MANQVPECDCTIHPNCCENEEGGPINTRTGNYDYEQQDFSIPALGEPLQFERTYNSLKAGTPALGNGWTHNYNLRLSRTAGGVTFESCGGQRYTYVENAAYGAFSYQGTPGVTGILTRTGTYGSYTYTLTTANNDRYLFDTDGLPIEIRNAQGQVTVLTYAGSQLTRVADATGQRYLNFTYNPQGRLSQISDPVSRTVQYGYDPAGNLTVVTDTLGKPWTYVYTGTLLQEIRNPAGEVVERTEFDALRRGVRQWRGNRLMLELRYLDTVDSWGLPAQTTVITHATGRVSTDYYNSRGTLMEQTDTAASTSKTFDANYNPAAATDPNGNPTSFVYNEKGRPLAITDALGSATSMVYDTQNHLIRLTDAAGNSSYYTYTGNLLTAQSDALGHTTIYTYNPQNLLIAQQDAQGRITEYEYNPWGQRTGVTTTEGVTHYEYDLIGRLITTTDAFNRVTVNVYDAADHLLTVTRNYWDGQEQNYQHAYNLITSYEYDAAGRQTAITDTLGRVNRNVYDENGQLIKTIVNFDPARAQNELNQYNITTEYGYDAAGRQVLVTDTLGHVSRTDYDVQSRPVTVTTNYKDGVYDPARPDEDIRRITEYDPAGNAIAQIDPLGRITRTWYDEVNRVISTTTNYDPTHPQNDQGEYNLITTYGYDQTGNRVWITDTLGRVTRNYYDPTGRLISTTANYLPGYEQNYLNQYNLNTFYGYDTNGRQYLVTNTLGLANHTAYDPVTGRPLTTTTNYADGVFNPAQPDEDVAQSTEYDEHGNPYLRRDAAGRATRTWYDELNRVISMTANYQPDRPQNDAGQYNLVTIYDYDELGNRAWVTDTLGHVTWTQYDALNRAVTVTQNYLPGQPANYLGQYNLVTTYEYDALGRQVATVDPLGRRTRVEFDQVGRTLAQIDPLEQRTEYAYDVLGNRTVMTDAANHVTRFEYDTLNRLITTTRYLNGNPIREVTHYDAAGNRVETIDARGQATTYGYDALGRTIAITDANLHVTTFTYDPLGRRSRMQDARGSGTDYVYDKLGRQIATSDPLGNTTGYGYDVSGNRVVMTDANQIVTRYEYDTLDRLSAVIENYTGGAQTTDRDVRTTYAYDPLGNRTVMTNARGYATTYEYDALNRLSRLQDARGKTTAYGYDALGNRTVMTDANGAVTLFAYDDLNRQTSIDYLTDATAVQYGYDAIGNRTAMTDTIGTTQYVFDDLNRLTSVTDPFAQTVGYAYDAAGNRTHVIYPDGKVVTTTYDAAGLLTGVIDWAGQTTTYAYDAANRLITVTLPNTVQTIYTYDNANRLVHLSHTRLSDDTLLADYEFTLDNVGNRVQVSEAMEYPGDSQVAALPPTLADAIVEAITGHRAPGLSAPAITGTLALPDPLMVSRVEPPDAVSADQTSDGVRHCEPHSGKAIAESAGDCFAALAMTPSSEMAAQPLHSAVIPAGSKRESRSVTVASLDARQKHASRGMTAVLAPLAGPGDIFADSFESGNFTAWSAAVTNTGRLSVITSAARWGTYGMRALITSTTAMYVRDDTPNAETRYRARFYFHPNSISMTSGNAHYIFVGRNTAGLEVLRVELRYYSGAYQIRTNIRNDSTTYSNSSWYTISNAWHAIEIDWQAATAAGANNGYITLWIDGALKQTVGSIDNDTRRVDEARLGPSSGIDSGTTGTEYFDAFESRRDTYIGPVALADFTASPVLGTAPLTVTFTNTSQPTVTLTAYLWNFGDGYTSTITNPVRTYAGIGNYTVTLTAWAGADQDTITRTRLITVAEVIFQDGFESGNLAAWSGAVTNTGRLSVTPAAAQSGLYGLRALITSTTAMYVRDDTPLAEPRYRARFYFHPNSISMTSGNAHYIFAGRTGSTDVLYVEFRYYSGNYQVRAQSRNDSTTYSSTSWYTIANGWHFIEIDWQASSAAGANNGSITLWIDGVLQGSVTGIDNDTRRVDEARLGPLSGIDSGTTGTEYFDTFESRRTTSIGPAGIVAAFTASPLSGTAPLTVTFTNTSQPVEAITAYLWNFGDGYTSTITNPVHTYLPGYYTVTLKAWAGTEANTVTKTNLITAMVKADFSASPVTGTAPLTVTFTNTSQPANGITAFLWNFGDGVTSTITNALHTYAPGYYTVTLTAWSGSLKDVITRTRLITASIKAGFTATPVAGNIPLTVTFTNTSQPIDGASTFNWNFGDGVTSTVVQPTHVYTREGTFGVTLTAKSGVMQDVLTRTNYITATDDTPVIGDFAIETDEGAAPATAHNTVRNEYLVVWRDAYGGISGQRVSSSGHLPGAAIVITNTPGVYLDEPRLAYDPANDQYLVVWVLEGGAGALQGRLVSGSGTPGTVFTFSDPASAYNAAAAVAYNPIAQAFLVTWYGEVDAVSGVWGQVVVNGALSGPAFSIAEESATATTLAVNPVTGDWLAVWTAGDQMEVRRVMSDGTPLGDVVPIATRVGFNSFHEIAAEADAAGNYLVVWRAGYGGNSTMRGQRVTAQGTLSGGVLDIVAADGNRHEEPALAYRAASQDFFVVWQDNAPGNYDVRGAYITAGGQVIASSVDVIADGSDQHSPAVAYGAEAQTYLLVWQDAREPAGIYARRWRLPAADFRAAPLSGRKPLTVTFSNLSLLTEDPVTHTWDFGDGTAGSAAISPTHVYSQRGTYSVSLTITTGTYTNTRQRADYIAVDPLHRTVITYTYDGLYRLTKADSTGALTTTFEYAYDPVGNRTTQTATITSTQVTTYQYDEANRLTTRTESTGQAYTYAWSDRGQMLAEYFQGNPIRNFTYNAAGQLSEATVLTLTTRFRYNGDGQRLSLEVVGGNTTTYALDYLKSNRILMETTAQTTTLYLYGHSCLGEWTATDGWKYYLQSTLGQVRQAVDDVGNVIYSWAFNPDGTVLQGVQGPITHLECDAVYDWRTGLIYRLGRYFDPTTGVWLMGTGMLLAQAGTGGKRRSKRRLLLLMLLLLCVAGVLAACNNNPGPSLDPDPCKEITPFSTSLGKNAVFVGPTQGNSLSEYPPAITWSSNDKQKIETDLTDAIENVFGGTGSPNANPPIGVGFGSLPATLTNLGVSEQNPIIVVRRVNEPNDPGSGSPAAAFKPWVYVHNAYFSSDAGWQKRSLVHEIAHYWDDANGQGLSKDMSQWINWGDTPTDYQTGNPREVFAETTTVYFLSQYRDKTREWTDDFGAGFDLAKRNGATGPDQLMLDMNTKQPSATGTEEAKDRYDFLQWKFTGNWK